MTEKTKQAQPGLEARMDDKPEVMHESYKGSDKLKGKKALITGGDSGIGRSAAVHFACEGADVAIACLKKEKEDAEETVRMVEEYGRSCHVFIGDIGDSDFCDSLIQDAVEALGGLDILVNNAGEQHMRTDLREITDEQLERTFRTNIFSMFYLTRSAIDHLKEGSSIINTASITAYKGKEVLMDYASTKGAIVAFTRSLAKNLADKNIRVNAVAPGPIWTPLIPATFPDVSDFGENTAMGRPGQPSEVGPAYVYLAAADSSYVTGQVIHINGGEIVGG